MVMSYRVLGRRRWLVPVSALMLLAVTCEGGATGPSGSTTIVPSSTTASSKSATVTPPWAFLPVSAIEATWTADLEAFRTKRERFLLYR